MAETVTCDGCRIDVKPVYANDVLRCPRCGYEFKPNQ